jgi:hypothetical protein
VHAGTEHAAERFRAVMRTQPPADPMRR